MRGGRAPRGYPSTVRRLLLIVVAAAALAAGCGSDERAGVETRRRPRRSTWRRASRCRGASRSPPGGDALVSERATGRILRIPAAGGEPRSR